MPRRYTEWDGFCVLRARGPTVAAMDRADSPLMAALDSLAELPEAAAGSARVSQAVRSVRFSTGLRRGWEAARTEASILWVLADCRAAGIEVSAKDLREQVAWSGEPHEPIASASWRCHSDVVADMPPLNTTGTAPAAHASVRTMLAGLHRDAASSHPDEAVRAGAGILSPVDTDRQDLLIQIAEARGHGLVTVAVLLGQWLTSPLTIDADPVIRGSFVRWLGTVRGFEPTGTAVLDMAKLVSQADLYASGTAEDMNSWLAAVADSYVDAMTRSLLISQSILAGRTDPELG